MATKRTFADLDLTREDKHAQENPRRFSYPATFSSTRNPFGALERQIEPSISTSRSARTLPLPSPTRFKSYPPSQVIPAWDLQGSQPVQQSPDQTFPPTPDEYPPRTVQNDITAHDKKDPSSPPCFMESDEASQVATGDSAQPETERQRLKAQIVLLQTQNDDLHLQMDLFRQQAAKKDTQYLQIIEQSTKREMQGVAESQRWRDDRRQWLDERQALQETIADLKSKLSDLNGYYSRRSFSEASAQIPVHSYAGKEPFELPTTLMTASFSQSITTTTAPGPPPSGTATPLDHLQYESGQLAEYSAKLVDIGKSIRMQLDVMTHASGR